MIRLDVVVDCIDSALEMELRDSLTVLEACMQVRERAGVGESCWTLFSPSRRCFFDHVQSLSSCGLRDHALVEFRSTFEPVRMQLLLDGSERVCALDLSKRVGENIATICEKLGVADPEEFVLAFVEGEGTRRRYLGSQETLLGQGYTAERKLAFLRGFVPHSSPREDMAELESHFDQCSLDFFFGGWLMSLEEATGRAAELLQLQQGDYSAEKVRANATRRVDSDSFLSDCRPHVVSAQFVEFSAKCAHRDCVSAVLETLSRRIDRRAGQSAA
jgi:hypothetical protein